MPTPKPPTRTTQKTQRPRYRVEKVMVTHYVVRAGRITYSTHRYKEAASDVCRALNAAQKGK